MPSWIEYVRRIQNGDPVEAGQANITIDALIQRDDYLKQAFDLATSGRALIEFDVELDPATAVGTPVYVDTDAGDVYTPAQALIFNSGPNIGQLEDEGYVKGIVITKTAGNRGHVALSGILDDIDWTAITDDGLDTPGHYFLSSTEAGKITLTRSAAAIYIGQLLTNGSFILSRNDDVSGEDHMHYAFVLTNKPAVAVPGDLTPAVPTVGNPWDISGVVDADERGWLNANHPSLGPAPAGAVFGYNIEQEAQLDGVFPPIPVLAAFMTLGGEALSSDQFLVDANGIWWLSDAYDEVPWPIDYDSTGEESPMDLYLTSLTTDTVSRGVSTLVADQNTVLPISILNTQGNAASAGDLVISITGLMLAGATDEATGSAVKSISGRTVNTGPVMDTLEIISTGLTATATVNDGGKLSGAITLALDAATINQFLLPGVTRLVGVQQDQFREFSYLSLPDGKDTSVIYQFTVPTQGVQVDTEMRLRLSMLGRGASALPDLVIEQRNLLPEVGSEAVVPSAWTAVETLSGLDVTGDTVETFSLATTITVQPGTEILLRVSRAGSSDGYASPVGILRADTVLEA